MYAELHCLSNFSFQRGASHPRELVLRAAELGYRAIAITDECSLAGVVKAHLAARECGIALIIGSELNLEEGIKLVALAPCRKAYGELSGLISMARRRSPKGEYRLTLRDVIFPPQALPADLAAGRTTATLTGPTGAQLRRLCKDRVWLGVSHLRRGGERRATSAATGWPRPWISPWWPAAMYRCITPGANPCTIVFTATCASTPASSSWAAGASATASTTCAASQPAQALYPPPCWNKPSP